MRQPGFILSLAFLTIFCASAAPLLAEEKKEAPPPKAADAAPANPALVKLEKRSLELIDTLDEPALKHLFHIRESFGSTRAVKTVRNDVQNAVKVCGTANPDMKETMNGRFAVWTAAIDPVVKEKEKETEAAIAAQTYLKPKEIRDYLKMIEKAADNVDRDITKVPVSTPEACKGLLKSMDSTETVLTELIGEMELMPWPPVVEEKPEQKISVPNN